MIKTFRGMIADATTDTIVLHTNDGSTGYRIVKFQVIGEQSGIQDTESTVTISKIPFTPLNTIDLSDNTILAVSYFSSNAAAAYPQNSTTIIFDQEIFNQDIYVGSNDIHGKHMNYYIELEQVKLDLSESTVATLKDVRNLEYPPIGG